MSISGGPDIIKNGLVLYLDAADDSSYINGSSTWYDMGGNNNNGTLTNGPTYNSGNKGSIVFDGVDDYVNVSIPSTDFEDATLGCWLNFADVTKNTQNFISLGDNASTIEANANSNNFNLGWYSTSKWHTNTRSGGSWASELNINASLPSNGIWYYVVGTYSVSGTSRKIYLNGNYLGGDSSYNNPGAVNIVRIGGGAFTWRFQGNISNVQIYNRALSSNEILQNFNSTKGKYNL